jgi:MFS family permease
MKYVLPIIVLAQFLCTTLWFVGNAVMPEVIAAFGLDSLFFAHQTSAVQFGFISGTLVFALLTIADRFSPSRVFFFSAIAGAVFNLGILSAANGFVSLLVLRYLTGFFLAGIYPVGMKIASDYFDKGLGKSLGFLVGALVLGTAFPHLLRGFMAEVPWKAIIITTSVLAIFGGLLITSLVPDGPHRRQAGKLEMSASLTVFGNRSFRSAAFGYFGHMWELYTFWAFVPLMLTTYTALHPDVQWNVPVLSFLIIGVGGVACVLSGYLSEGIGLRTSAAMALLSSGACCLLSPLIFAVDAPWLFLGFLIFWGMAVIADSPLFSTLVAQNANPHHRGTALTMVNCIGFSITIVSIQVIGELSTWMDAQYLYIWLAAGPLFGLISLALGRKEEPQAAL